METLAIWNTQQVLIDSGTDFLNSPLSDRGLDSKILLNVLAAGDFKMQMCSYVFKKWKTI